MEPHPAILIVEDDPAVAAFLKRLVTASGFEAQVAPDEESAFACAAKRRPDLLLVDLILGAANGWQVARKVARGAPFIVMTGAEVDADIKRDAELLGAAAVVAKPFDAAQLISLIGRVLAGGA